MPSRSLCISIKGSTAVIQQLEHERGKLPTPLTYIENTNGGANERSIMADTYLKALDPNRQKVLSISTSPEVTTIVE